MRQSAFAMPDADMKARWREMRRSELVTVPAFSPQLAAGSSTSAKRVVSVRVTSETTTKSQAFRAARTRIESGIDTAGFVPMIQSALMLPSPTPRNISTAFKPGARAMSGAFQKRATRSTSGGSKPMCAAS